MKDEMRHKNKYVHLPFTFIIIESRLQLTLQKPISKQLYYFNQSEFLAIMYLQLAQSMRTALNIEI